MQQRPLGRSGLPVTPLCVGTSALGNFPAQYGYEVGTEQAIATIRRALRGPLNFIDTSNEYGGGDSERRIGRAIAAAGGLPPDFVLATKVDPIRGSTDFSGERVRRSVAESLERLGVDRLQLVYLHDPEKIGFAEGMARGGPVEALAQLRDEGVIDHLGVAGGPINLMLQYLATDVFDVAISHNRYTLVDQSAEPLLQDAARRNVGFVNGAPYGGGMLVKGRIWSRITATRRPARQSSSGCGRCAGCALPERCRWRRRRCNSRCGTGASLPPSWACPTRHVSNRRCSFWSGQFRRICGMSYSR